MACSIAIIGAGQIGYAAAIAFFTKGWDVTIHARSAPAFFEFPNHWQRYILGEDPVPDADLVLDTIAYDEEDVARYDPDRVGKLITISSASVYCDDQGRTLDEGREGGYPEFSEPISERQAIVTAGPQTYSTRKVRMEEKAHALFGSRSTILRPCAIHGRYSRHPREWWFVKRLLDRRTHIPLMHKGQSQFQTSAAQTIAEFALHAADHNLSGRFNIADSDSASVLEIGQNICAQMERDVEFVLADDGKLIGRTPWSLPHPFCVSGAKAKAHGFKGASSYAETSTMIRWLSDHHPADWREAFPQLAVYPWDLFDYEAEDRFFATQ